MAAEACLRARKFVPSFAVPFHKGQHGRVVVIGGSIEYSGAPCYAAMAALRTGADLAWVICAPEAAGAIKAFSPELIVIPGLPSAEENERVARLPAARRDAVARLAAQNLLGLVRAARPSAVVVGPGLGREVAVQAAVSAAIEMLCQGGEDGTGPAVVLDADALWAVACKPSIVRGGSRVVITPNAAEAARIAAAAAAAAKPEAAAADARAAAAAAKPGPAEEGGALGLSKALGGGVTVVLKGAEDMVARAPVPGSAAAKAAGADGADGGEAFAVSHAGSPRRCGGQGDVLAGALGALASWAGDDLPAASAAACAILRDAARSAFAKHRRATVTPDILSELGLAFERVLPDTLGVELERAE
ncbi:hypothetical protein FNF27_06158 [Cafeteria roenbergensis]|uniref:ATP-dependent (S)-NAD(P)H-hydrate dehydratase n=2 Tax=Cafeteria roenbergensis TaxID=33653 RepID=A0A5A8E2Z2_CAFRO|nr:hypothetical protein FNF27_06158 [Cafeteria roenbergensis]